MSVPTAEQIARQVEKIKNAVSGDRAQMVAILDRLLGFIRDDTPTAPESSGTQMLPSAATPKPRSAPPVSDPEPEPEPEPEPAETIDPSEDEPVPQKATRRKKSRKK